MSTRHEKLSFELQRGRLHVIVSSLSSVKWLRLLSNFGVGVTYFPLRRNWMQNPETREAYRTEIQREFNNLVIQIPNVRSLDVATLVPLNLGRVSTLRNLRSVNVIGPVLDCPDLGQLRHLRKFSGRHPSIQNVQGLRELDNLRYVEVPFPTKTFVANLPQSLAKLYLQCRLPKNLNLSHLVQLRVLCIDSVGELDFTVFSAPVLELDTLELSEIAHLKFEKKIGTLFPKLKTLSSKLEPALNADLRNAISKSVKIKVPFFWRIAKL